jgi:hypothetical protein
MPALKHLLVFLAICNVVLTACRKTSQAEEPAEIQNPASPPAATPTVAPSGTMIKFVSDMTNNSFAAWANCFEDANGDCPGQARVVFSKSMTSITPDSAQSLTNPGKYIKDFNSGTVILGVYTFRHFNDSIPSGKINYYVTFQGSAKLFSSGGPAIDNWNVVISTEKEFKVKNSSGIMPLANVVWKFLPSTMPEGFKPI